MAGCTRHRCVHISKQRRLTYDFVIIDPPYADADIIETLELLAASSLVQSGTIVVIGHWPRIELPEPLGRLELPAPSLPWR